jgi:hypothetical protein
VGIKYALLTRAGGQKLLRSTSRYPTKWALAMRREMLMAIGQQLRVECELPPELTRPLIRRDNEQDPYADIVGTC